MPFLNRVINYSRSLGKKYLDTFLQKIWNPADVLVHSPEQQYVKHSHGALATSADGKIITIGLQGECRLSYNVKVSCNYGDTFTPIRFDPSALSSVNCYSSYNLSMSSDGSKQVLAVGGPGPRVLFSWNTGVTWNYSNGLFDLYSNGGAMSSDGSIVTFATQTGIFVSVDTGANYTARINNINMSDVAMSSDGRIQYAISSSPNVNIYCSTNTGFTWGQLNTTNLTLGAIGGYIETSSDGSVLAILADCKINVSTNYGQNWYTKCFFQGRIQGTGSPVTLFGIKDLAMSSDGSKLTTIAGDGPLACIQSMLSSSDYGRTWIEKCLPADGRNPAYPNDPDYIKSIAMSADGKKQIAVGYSVYRSYI